MGSISGFWRDIAHGGDGAFAGRVVFLIDAVIESLVWILVACGREGDRGVAFCTLSGFRTTTLGRTFETCAVGLGLGLNACLTFCTTRFELCSSSVLSQSMKEASGS